MSIILIVNNNDYDVLYRDISKTKRYIKKKIFVGRNNYNHNPIDDDHLH